MHMHRAIGLIGLTFVAVSGIIGSGWLFAPLMASQQAGPAALVAWALGGVAMLLLALTFAEISAMLPVPGGVARVPQFSHGNVVAMAMGWSGWVGYNTTAPIEVEAMLRYLAPHADWLYAGPGTLSWAGVAVATALMATFTVINAYGVRFFALVNTTITWAKIAIPLVVVAALIGARFEPANFTARGGFAPYGLEGVLAAVSSGGIIFSYIGFRHAVDMAGEAKNPGFTLPTALILSVIICFVLYGGIQLAFLGALPDGAADGGWAQLALPGTFGPLGAIAAAIGMLWLVSLLNVGAVVAPFGGGLVAVGSNARIAFALAENGFFPKVFATLSRHGVPLAALLLNLAFSTVVFVALPFDEVVRLNSSAIVLSFVVGPIAVVALRALMPARRRPFRLPAVRLIGAAAFVVATLIVYWSGWSTVWRLGLALLAGLVLFLANRGGRRPLEHLPLGSKRSERQDYARAVESGAISDRPDVSIRSESALDTGEAVWLVPYLLGLAALSYAGAAAFGGRDLIPFGWDMAAIAVFAVAVFAWAVRSRLSQEKFDRYLAEEHVLEQEAVDDPAV
mgnify:CR=1 FL=1